MNEVFFLIRFILQCLLALFLAGLEFYISVLPFFMCIKVSHIQIHSWNLKISGEDLYLMYECAFFSNRILELELIIEMLEM